MYVLKNLVLLRVFLLMLGAFTTVIAQAGTTSQTSPQRIHITLEAMDVPPSVMDQLERTIPQSSKKAALTLDALVRDHITDIIEISLETPNDFPGIATYDKIISFTDKNHPGQNFTTLETRLSATPHLGNSGIEKNDIIAIKLDAMVAEISSARIPKTNGMGISFPVWYFKNGEITMFRFPALSTSGKLVKPTDNHALDRITFITAVVLPASNEVVAAENEPVARPN